MPSTVHDIFAAVGLEPAGPVRWGEPVPESATGVYIVATAAAADELNPTFSTLPRDDRALAGLLAARTELRLDDGAAQPSVSELAARLAAFWLPDEVVLYVGLAGQPLGRRVRQYYRTPLGKRRPHAGGWWLKTLSVLPELFVYWAATPAYADAEKAMLRAFAESVSPATRGALYDVDRVMPFANLRGCDDRIKRHAIPGATGD